MTIAERGVAQTRVADIVERAAISRRTLYEQFESIDAILDAIYERAVRTAFQAVIAQLEGIVDPIERIHVGVRTYYDIIASDPPAARVVFEYRHAGPAQAAKYELHTARYVTLMLELLTAVYAAGQLARQPDEASVYALIRGLDAVGVRALHRGEQAQLAGMAPVMSRLLIAAFGG